MEGLDTEGRNPTHLEAGGQAGLRLEGGPESPPLHKKDEVKGWMGVLGAQERGRGFQPAPGEWARVSGRAEGRLKALPTGLARLTQGSCFPGGLAGNRGEGSLARTLDLGI